MNKAQLIHASILTAALLLSSRAVSGDLLLIDDNLDVLPPGYTLIVSATANATAAIEIGDIGGSNGLIFDGSWDVPDNGQESAVASMSPVIPAVADFQLNPVDIAGISSIRWMLDVEVISSTMVAPEQGIFAQLVIFQLQPGGGILSFADSGNFIQVGESKTLDIVAVESDFGQPGARPDFGRFGRPLSFGLQFGATYPRTTNPNAFFVDGRLTADNWLVEITGDAGIFSDSFESEAPTIQAVNSKTALDENCNCPVPPVHSIY